MSVLTTVTVYWSRPLMLKLWMAALHHSKEKEKVRHLVLFVNEPVPEWFLAEKPSHVEGIAVSAPPNKPFSIGTFHDQAARELVPTPWMMKMDVDTLANPFYFADLVALLEDTSVERKWYCGGMFYTGRRTAQSLQGNSFNPLPMSSYQFIMNHRKEHCNGTGWSLPGGTQFICRRQDYLNMGGCGNGFQGWGWEDYWQVWQLQRQFLRRAPFDDLRVKTVTQMCRDRIARPLLLDLWKQHPNLCLIHVWHPVQDGSLYRNAEQTEKNRQHLYNLILHASNQ